MNFLTIARRNLGIAIAALIVTAAGYSFLFWLLSQNAVEVSEIAAQVAMIDGQEGQISSARRTLIETREERMLVSQFFLYDQDIVEFMSAIESLGRALGANVEISAIDTDPVPEGKQIGTISASIEVRGGGQNVRSFISSMSSLRYAITVTNLTTQKTSENMTANIAIRVPLMTGNEPNVPESVSSSTATSSSQ